MSDLAETVRLFAERLRSDPEFAGRFKERRKIERAEYAKWFASLPPAEQQRLHDLEAKFRAGIDQ